LSSLCIEFSSSIDTMIIIGGSVAILICFIIPSAAYLSLVCPKETETEDKTDDNIVNIEDVHFKSSFSSMIAWIFIITFVPIMAICGGNAIYIIIFNN